ncbi:hypothetical protein [Microbacterium cremeum]|uniref:hypothetical protein n=1 Tax=Microbacterium cremeum TaxID=2782169 RepID=UPI001889ADB0|nr:hypothetical protein [Microbacterium cremeum]
MADVEFSDSDFTGAVSHLLDAGDTSVDAFCVAFGALGSAVVESAVGDVDGLVRHAMAALAGVGGDLSTDVGTVHTELRALDAQLAGAGG